MSNFFSQLSNYNATPYARAKVAKEADPIKQAQVKFARAADEQIKLIKSAADKGLWFKREGDAVIVSLKNGVAVINKDNPSFKLPDAASAVKFIEAAKEASGKGEFDELFKATARPARKPKDEPTAALNSVAEAPKSTNKRK